MAAMMWFHATKCCHLASDHCNHLWQSSLASGATLCKICLPWSTSSPPHTVCRSSIRFWQSQEIKLASLTLGQFSGRLILKCFYAATARQRIGHRPNMYYKTAWKFNLVTELNWSVCRRLFVGPTCCTSGSRPLLQRRRTSHGLVHNSAVS